MAKGNDVIPNGHFHKNWKENVRTDFGQPARKARRRRKRNQKALENPLKPSGGALRPVVRCPTDKYNAKVRKGKGFTVEELKVRKCICFSECYHILNSFVISRENTRSII